MKLNVLPLLTGAMALSLSIAAALPAFSQTTPTTPTQPNHAHRENFLNLTADQQAKMKQVRQNERTQIDNILTADQKAQLQRDRQNHEAQRTGENRGTAPTGETRKMHRSPFDSLNLTADQRTQIEAVRRTAKAQMDAILTPDQRTQLQQHMKQRPQAN